MRRKKKEEKKKDIQFEGKRPYSALKRFLVRMLPACCIHFLYSSSSKFKITKVFLGAGFGVFFGIVVNSLLVNELSLSEQQKIQLLYCITGIFAFGCAFFSNFRCSMIMTLPNIFCEEGHAYLLVLVMGSIYAGPITNLEKNVEEVIRSIGCSVELQINHTKLMWKILISPIKKIAEDLVSAGKEMKNDTSVLNLALEEMNDELNNMDGMDKKEYKKRLKLEKTENNTMWSIQNKFNLKTVLRCEYIAEKGIEKCKDWFDQKHDECMSTIAVPLINFLLCLPMKFKVFCFILRLSTKWCQDNVPVDSNFGLLYDTVNKTIYNMHKGFKSEITVKKQQQDMFLGFNTSKLLITDEIMENVDNKRVVFEKVMSVLRILMRFAFIYFFISAFIYCNKYNRDIQFDNMYITTYFKQIDARRRKKKKRHLLPLRKGEYESFVFPLKIKIQGPEWTIFIKQILHIIPIIFLLVISIFIDFILYRLFEIIRKHSFISYQFTSGHKLEILVGGDGFLANLLRRTVRFLNTSSEATHYSTNVECLPNIRKMSERDYFDSFLPTAIFLMLTLGQVYISRLRRIICSFFNPKREKRRILFLYNDLLRKRETYADIKRKIIMHRAKINTLLARSLMATIYRHFKFLHKFIRRRCAVCNEVEQKDSYVCTKPDCGTVYCRQCWRDMNKFCFACEPYEDFTSADDTEEEL